jgi:adenylate cyclase
MMRLRGLKRRQTISSVFENEFALEILKSDKLRVTILLCAWTGTFLMLMLLSFIFSTQFQNAFHGRFNAFRLNLIIGSTVSSTCLLVELLVIDRLIKMRKQGRPVMRYLSAFIETSIPTLGLILSSQFLGPVYGLATPAPFAYGIFIVLSVLRLDFRLCVFTGAVAAVEYVTFAWYATNQTMPANIEPILVGFPQHLFKGCLLFGTGLVAGMVTIQIKRRILRSIETIAERNRISRTFGEYVSPAVMNMLLDLKPDLRSEIKDVCVMFLDIRDFTGFAEKRSPEEVVTYLESLFEFMIEIVNRNHGIINKFLGDGFMAVFGAPLSDGADCANAVRSAQEILARVRDEAEQGRILPTTVGIGLHAGEAVTGSIGSALRREYTVIGDVVNLASRIEKLNKQFGSQLLISEMVSRAAASETSGAVSRGTVKVRGREEGIQIFQLA